MTKKSGSGRQVKEGSSEYKKRLAEVAEMRASGNYSSVEMCKNGGYVAIEKSKTRHKDEEIEMANFLGDKGYKVILKDETIAMTVTGKTSDGYLYSATFEQRTPTSRGAKGVNKSLEHAKQKEAEIAVIFDKYNTYKRKEVEDGIKLYESFTGNKHRFKEIIIVSSKGNVHVHRHNK